jgi:hypothetical protein
MSQRMLKFPPTRAVAPRSQLSIQDHIIKTYASLRLGIGLLAMALPIILAGGGYVLYGLTPQDSISAYYHAFVPTELLPNILAISGNGLMRNWMVGMIWAVGVFLILYRGRSDSSAGAFPAAEWGCDGSANRTGCFDRCTGYISAGRIFGTAWKGLATH